MTRIYTTKILQVASATLGLIGSVVMVMGVVGSNPNDIAKLSGLYFGINPNYLVSLAESKANTIIGLLLLSSSFCIQIIIYLYEEKLLAIYITKKKMLIFLSVVILAIVIAITYRHNLIKDTIYQTYKQMAYLDLEQQYNYNKVNGPKDHKNVILSESQIEQLKGNMETLGFNKKNNESTDKYFVRFCDHLGHKFCSKIDFEKSLNIK